MRWPYKLQIDWVLKSWNNISSEIVKKSFNICGITQHDAREIHCMKENQPAYGAVEELNRLLAEGGSDNFDLDDEEGFIVERAVDDYDEDDVMEEQELVEDNLDNIEVVDVAGDFQDIINILNE